MNSAPLPGVHISALSVAHMKLLDVAQLALPTSLHVTLPPTPSTHTPHPGDHSSSVNTYKRVCGGGGFRGNKAGHRREGAQTRDDKPPDGERNGEKRLQAGSLVPNSPRGRE